MSMKAITFIAVMSLALVFASAGFAEKGPDYDQAVKYYDSGNYRESVRIFQEYVKKRPDASAYYRIGYGLYKLGKHREAEGYFQQAYLIDPTFSPELAGAPQKYPKKEMRRTPKASHKRQHSQRKSSLSKDSTKESQAKPEAPLVASTSNSNKAPSGKDQPAQSGKGPSIAAQAKTAQPPATQPTTTQPAASQPKTAQTPAAQPKTDQPMAPQMPLQEAAKSPMNPPSFVPLQPPMTGAATGLVAAILAGFGMLLLLPAIALYVYFSLCLFLIAKKLGVPNPWIAWIPLASVWTLVASAGKPWWWILLLIVPIVNFFIAVYLWVAITENLGRNKWLGLLMLVPIINLVFLGVLAFSKTESSGMTMETATPA